jgi:Large polyvalent protein associated domain 38
VPFGDKLDRAKDRLDAAKAHYAEVVAKRAKLEMGSPPYKAMTPAYHAAAEALNAARAEHGALVVAGRDALTRPRGGDVKSAPAARPLFKPGETLAFSADISPALRGVAEGWAKLLGLDRVQLVVSTPSGGTKLAAEHGLVAGTKEHQMLTRPMPAAADGSVGTFSGHNVESIMLKPGMSERKTLEVLAHEMGHTLQRHTFDSAPEAVQREIRSAHQAWLAARHGDTTGQFMTALRPFGDGDAGISPSVRADPRPAEQSLSRADLAYVRSFEEWFADNTAKWATSRAEPLSVVDKFFKDLADKLRAFFLGAPEMYKPDETLAKWLDGLNPKFRADQVRGATDFDPNDPGPNGGEYLSQQMSEPVMAQAEYSHSITPPKAIGAAMKWAAARLEGNDRARTVDEYRAQAEGRAMPKRNLLAGHNISGRLMDTFVDTLVKAEVAFTDEHRRAEEQAQTILKKTGASGVQLAQYRARLDRAVADLRASSARLVLEARLFRNKGDAFLRQHNGILDNVQDVIVASKPEGVEIDAWRARANLYAQAVHIIDRHAAKSAELQGDVAKARMALRRAEAEDNVPGGAKGEGDKLAAAEAALAAYEEANDAEPTRTTNERGEAVDTFAFPMPGGVRLKDARAVVAAGADQQAGLRAVQAALVEGFRSLNRLAVREGRAAKSDIDAVEAAFPNYVSLMGNSEREVTDLGNTKRRAFIDSSRGATHAGQAVMPDEALGHKLKGLAASVGRAEFDQMLLAHARLNRTGSIPLTVNGRTGPDMLELPTSNIVRLASDFGPEETRPDDLHIRRIQSGHTDGEVSETAVAIDNHAVVDGLFETPFIENELGRTAARATRVYGMMVTRFTAAFAPLNMARDMGERLFNIVGLQGRELDAKQVNQVRAHMVGLVKDAQTWADIKSYAFDGPDAFVKARPDSPLARLAKAGGLTTLTQFLSNEAQYDKAILARGSVPAQAWGKVKHAVEVYNQLFETLVPLATFDALQTVAGMDDQTAAGVTARMFDLRARGKVAPHMSALYTFFSPTAYGAKTFWETLNSGPRAKAELLGMAAAAGMLYLILQGMDDEDENGKPLLDAQNDALTDGSIPIPLGGGSYAKVPMAFGGPRVAWILGVRTLRVMQGVDSPYDGVAAVLNEMVKTTLPTGVSQESVVENPSRFLAKTLTPSALKGLTNLATNTNSFGNPLTYAHREGEYKSEQGQYTTPEVYSDMARSVREATGGMLDSSPESVRELLGSALVGPAAALLTMMAHGDKEAKGLTESVMRDGVTGAMVQAVGGGRLLSTQSDDARDRFLVNKLSARAIHLVREVNVRNPHVGTDKESPEDKMQRAEAAGMEGNDLAILDAYFKYQNESHSTGRKLSKLRAAHDRDLDELKDTVSEQQGLMRRFIAAGAAL